MSFVIPEDAKNGDTIHMIAKATDDGEHNLMYYQRVVITVTGADTIDSVTVSGSNSVEVESKTTLTASVLPETVSNKKVTWSSSDPSVATVSTSGLVTGVAKGTATITATSVANPGKAGTFEITVTARTYESANTGKVRTIITQDGELDDMNSLIHYLLYANEFDTAGIILTSSQYHWEGSENAPTNAGKVSYRWEDPEWMFDYLERYEEVYDNLKSHNSDYPEPDYLRSVMKMGNIGYEGEMDGATDGSNLIKDAILDNDERTLYIQLWGGPNTTSMALKQIEEEYKDTPEWDAIYQKVVNKVVLLACFLQDKTYDNYIAVNWPEITLVDTSGAYAFDESATATPESKTYLKGSWMYEHIDYGHGALLDKYITYGDGTHLENEIPQAQYGSSDEAMKLKGAERYDFLSEGDSPCFFLLIENGLRSMEDWSYGGWSGRMVKSEKLINGEALPNYYKYTNDYIASRDATEHAMKRWMADIQQDFAERADWCIESNYTDANHNPSITIQEGLNIEAKPGERVYLNAATSDPDKDYVNVSWLHYMEAGTYRYYGDADPGKPSAIEILGNYSKRMSFVVPEDAKNGDTIHMIAVARDTGVHNLCAYQRVIITVTGRQEINTIDIGTYTGSDTFSITDSRADRRLTIAIKDAEGNTLPNKSVEWSSSDENMATVELFYGNVIINVMEGATGQVTIRATATDGSNMYGEITLNVVGTVLP